MERFFADSARANLARVRTKRTNECVSAKAIENFGKIIYFFFAARSNWA